MNKPPLQKQFLEGRGWGNKNYTFHAPFPLRPL